MLIGSGPRLSDGAAWDCEGVETLTELSAIGWAMTDVVFLGLSGLGPRSLVVSSGTALRTYVTCQAPSPLPCGLVQP